MMTDEKQDSIDRELTRAYFANTRKYGPLDSTKNSNTSPEKKRAAFPYFKVTITALLAVFVLLSVLALSAKRLVFSVNISIEPSKIASEKIEQKKSAELAPKKTKRKSLIPSLASIRFPWAPTPCYKLGNQKKLYDFEKNDNGWEIPMWALDKPDHVGTFFRRAKNVASSGRSSIELYAEFPGNKWSAAIAEVQQYLDLEKSDTILADIYLPLNAPKSLRGKFILTVGDDWKFVEVTRGTRLKNGGWTTIMADLSTGNRDWKKTKITDAFRKDVRKIAIRVESERKGAYSGPIYIDNIRAGNRAK